MVSQQRDGGETRIEVPANPYERTDSGRAHRKVSRTLWPAVHAKLSDIAMTTITPIRISGVRDFASTIIARNIEQAAIDI